MISIHHEKQITGSGRENSQPFWLFNPAWTLRECIDIIQHIFVATNEATIHKKHITALRTQPKSVRLTTSLVLLQSWSVNVNIKYFQLSIRSDACTGWVWAFPQFKPQKTKERQTIQNTTQNIPICFQISQKELWITSSEDSAHESVEFCFICNS